MSLLGGMRTRAAGLAPSQWVIRAVVAAGVVVAAFVTMLQPEQPVGGLMVAAGLVGLVLVVQPQVIVAPLFHVLIMLGWLMLPDDGISPSALLVAAAMILVQLGSAAAAATPPHVPVPPSVLRPYAVAALALVIIAAALLVGLSAVRQAGLPGHLALMIMAVLGVAGLGLAVLGQLLVRSRKTAGSTSRHGPRS